MTLSLAHVLGGIYAAGTLLCTGWFVGDEMDFQNPEYGLAVAYAVAWPVLVLFLAFKMVSERDSA